MFNAAFAFIGGLGYTELIIIAIVAVLLFGKRLPELGRTLGKGLVSFRKGMNEMKSEFNSAMEDSEPEQSKDKAEEIDGKAKSIEEEK